jgi:hypothetical protein
LLRGCAGARLWRWRWSGGAGRALAASGVRGAPVGQQGRLSVAVVVLVSVAVVVAVSALVAVVVLVPVVASLRPRSLGAGCKRILIT